MHVVFLPLDIPIIQPPQICLPGHLQLIFCFQAAAFCSLCNPTLLSALPPLNVLPLGLESLRSVIYISVFLSLVHRGHQVWSLPTYPQPLAEFLAPKSTQAEVFVKFAKHFYVFDVIS